MPYLELKIDEQIRLEIFDPLKKFYGIFLHPPTKFHETPASSFSVIVQRIQQTDQAKNQISVAEIKKNKKN